MDDHRYIHVRNWDRYQHSDATRGGRALPWIKSYTQQLSELEYLELSYSDRGLLEALRLQYALNRGAGIEHRPTVLNRLLGQPTRNVQVKRLSDAGFLVISACKLHAVCTQPACLDIDIDIDREPSDMLPHVGDEPADADIHLEPRATTAGQDFVRFFVEEVRRSTGKDPLPQAKARVGRDALVLLRQGASADVIVRAISELVSAGLIVGALHSVADQLQRGGFKGHNGGRGSTAAEIYQWAQEQEGP